MILLWNHWNNLYNILLYDLSWFTTNRVEVSFEQIFLLYNVEDSILLTDNHHVLISVVSGGVVTASKSIYFLTWMSLLMINFQIPFMNIRYWWCCSWWWWYKNQWWLFNLTPQLFTLITIELNLHLKINQLVCMLTMNGISFLQWW